ncbi:hypothetical protein [Pandoraea sp. ISTKB]|uniref:hypothetical protein n=1 Tax=Pandoraea sp. ISTKB TaxID=1586708 RepID=UPI000846C1F5|nr:hypothetical protein [Pandoraea sp. ISTKB]ODP31507.1 hypothetical protein A9762_25955 [Pandoraea sp. ISTKB]
MTRYVKEMGGALLAYVVVLAGSIRVLQAMPDLPLSARVPIALLPMLPGFAMCWAIVRNLRRMDELQRRIQLESFSVSFAGTGLITFGYGFLEGVGFPKLSLFVVWPLMCTLWVVSGLLCARRYR